MKIRILMATATAASVLLTASAAMSAGSNVTNLTQQGNNNVASVDQSGSTGGIAGEVSYAGQHRLMQQGDDNKLTIVQLGNYNIVAGWVASGTARLSNGHLWQYGPKNEATITQKNPGPYSGNGVLTVHQDSKVGSDVTANKLVIEQGLGATNAPHVRNVVANVYQDNSAAETDVLSDQNSMTIKQVQIGALGDDFINGYYGANYVKDALQKGAGNKLTLLQTGLANYVVKSNQDGGQNEATIDQKGQRNLVVELAQVGSDNLASLKFDGNRNGVGATGALSMPGSTPFGTPTHAAQAFTAGKPAAAVTGVSVAAATQTGTDHNLDYAAVGNSNLFAFVQANAYNDIYATVSGDYNELAVKQDGLTNEVDVLQSGNSNIAGISQVGNNNRVNAKQQAGNNQLTALISGDNNGNALRFAPSGPPAVVNGMTTLADARGLKPGDLFQTGGGSQTMTLTITNSSNNQFGFLQTGGTGNTLTATISGTGGNKALGIQDGSSNTATLTQAGASNTSMFQQIGNNNTSTISQ